MKSVAVQDPKDDQIINNDDSVTNKDGNNDLEKGVHPFDQKKSNIDQLSTKVPAPADDEDLQIEDESSASVGQGQAVENL